jgi:transcriptional regulator with XRE-family HTH domain
MVCPGGRRHASGMKREVRPQLVKFGVRLRELRLKAGMTQEQVADRAGLAREYVSGAETGRRNATLTTIYQLADALGVDAGELVGGTAPEEKQPGTAALPQG